MNKFNKGIASLIAIIIIVATALIGGSVAYYYYATKVEEQKLAACTQEAKICPDGSSVSRAGPNCEFVPCPDSETDKDKKVSKCEFADRSGCDTSCVNDSDCKPSFGSCVNINESVYLPPNANPMYEIVGCKCENQKCVSKPTGEFSI